MNDATIIDALETNARWRAREPAVFCEGRSLDWLELDHLANRIAGGLIELGAVKGQRVAILTSNRLEHLACVYGVMKAGGCAVPLSPYLNAEILGTLIRDASVMAIIGDAELQDLAETACVPLKPDLGLHSILIGGAADGWIEWQSFLSGSDVKPSVAPTPEDEAVVIYSSGTTGTPKGIVHTHHSRREFALGLALALRLKSTSHGLVTTPLCSNGSCMIYLPCLAAGVPVTITAGFSTETFFKSIEDNGCTFTFAVPTQSRAILEAPDFDDHNFSNFENLVSSGAALPQKLKRAICAKLPNRLIELYGQTEGVATILYPEEADKHLDTVGRPGVGTDIVILSDEGTPLPRGEIGEIAGWSTSQMSGYLNRPQATQDVWWSDSRGRRYVKTGDIGRINEHGYLQILDRKKDMIVSGGFNVFPKDIERILVEHPAVSDVAVIGVPHERWGETPVGVVILDTASCITEGELMAWTNERVAKIQRISKIIFRENDYPRNLIGKVLKRELRSEYTAVDITGTIEYSE